MLRSPSPPFSRVPVPWKLFFCTLFRMLLFLKVGQIAAANLFPFRTKGRKGSWRALYGKPDGYWSCCLFCLLFCIKGQEIAFGAAGFWIPPL